MWYAAETNTIVDLPIFVDTLNFNSFWSYDGSLTTPPCTEGIKWTVLSQVQRMTQDQFDNYDEMWRGNFDYARGEGNNRRVQPLNMRTLYTNDEMIGWGMGIENDMEMDMTTAIVVPIVIGAVATTAAIGVLVGWTFAKMMG